MIGPTKAKLVDCPYVQPDPRPPIFTFEDEFKIREAREWMAENWTLSLYIAAGYLALIYIGQKLMKDRNAFKLKRALLVWNGALAIFSILGVWRSTPETLQILFEPDGFYRSLCVREGHSKSSAFWAWALTLSKVVDLFDTAFLVLRKKPVPTFHYVHHSVALILTWFVYPFAEPILRYFGGMNYMVHVVLYTYFFFKTLGYQVPRVVAKFIVKIELSQLYLGIFFNICSVLYKVYGTRGCARDVDSIYVGVFCYGILAVVLVVERRNKRVAAGAGSSATRNFVKID